MRQLLADTTPLKVSPDYRRLWVGLSISNIGTQVTIVAVGLQIYALTDSTLAVGVLGLFSLVPLVALGLYGGALVDHYDRRKVSLLSSLVLWVVVAAIAAQAWLRLESVHLLYGLVAVQSAAFAINNPARSAIIPRLLPKELMPAANALATLSMNVALTGGPLIGAVLVARLGYAWAYTLDMVLFLAALWAVFRLPPVLPERAGDGAGRTRVGTVGLRSVLDGLRYLATQPNVRTTFLVDICAMVLAFPRVLWPAAGVIYLGGGEATTGVLAAAFAVGGVLASVFSGGLTRMRRQGQVIVWAITAWGFSIAAFGLVLVLVGRGSPDGAVVWAVVAAGVALAFAGGSDSISAVFRQSILQTATPDHMRGRLQGVFIVVVAGGPRLGEMVLGAEATWFGEGWAAVVGGLTCVVLLWVIVRLTPRFWHYDARHPEP
ncbi:MFS transporter [Promicromonospora thailandica]|uniref:Arabinose efflux permease, MFS family n=1 Tax=Promicromonospora thailandica TaxID=765201 RepID=A0A9X2JV10_9MICO|nr:MFS transporter [Promicromonospora thailandica]MCP2265080.1 putative arabinose efflux permease, MFS family [Promicromonospora thailandica]BFF19860.1 MFS transporter [Promicromonospora thailandica]